MLFRSSKTAYREGYAAIEVNAPAECQLAQYQLANYLADAGLAISALSLRFIPLSMVAGYVRGNPTGIASVA